MCACGLVGCQLYLSFDIGRGLGRPSVRRSGHIRNAPVNLFTVRPKDEREMWYRQMSQHEARLGEGYHCFLAEALDCRQGVHRPPADRIER